MTTPATPALELTYSTPYRFRVLGVGDFEAEQTTQFTFDVALNNTFTPLKTSAVVGLNLYEYTISSTDRSATHYVRLKTTNSEGESAYSATLTIPAMSKPTTPVLEEKTASPQRVAVGVTNNIEADVGFIKIEFSKSSSFTPVLHTAYIETGPALAEYRVPVDDRGETHYARAKSAFIADIDATGAEQLWESNWSDTVTCTPGRVHPVDISSIRADQVEKSPMFGTFDAGWEDIDPNLDSFLSRWEQGEVGGPYEGKIRSKDLTGMPFRTVITSPETIDITNSMVLANTGLNFYADTYTYRIRLSAVIQFSAVTDLKFRLNGPTYDSGHIMKRVGDGADVTDTEVTLGTPTVAVENWPSTTTITKTGTGTHFAVIQYEGIVTPATAGVIALQAADATSQGSTFAASAVLRVGSFIEWEEISVSGGLFI